MAEFSELKTLELWYQAMGADDLVANIKDPDLRQRALKRLQKEKARSIADDIFPRLVAHNGDIPVIKDQLPTIFHAEGHSPGEIEKVVLDSFAGYRETLPPAWLDAERNRRHNIPKHYSRPCNRNRYPQSAETIGRFSFLPLRPTTTTSKLSAA
jgi:hypothetical protein